MAEVYKTLGQVATSATTATLLYTVPVDKRAVISTITVCNRSSASSSTFRVSVRVGGEAENNKQYIYYDIPIPSADTFAATLGITLAQTDEIYVYAGGANLTFQIWGTEIDDIIIT